MPIPFDSQKREWLDASNNNPEHVNMFRPCMIAYLGFDYNHIPVISGSGFIIGISNNYAVALTAKHVLTEGVLYTQRPIRHAPSALFIPDSSTKPSIDESKLRVIWMGNDTADLLFVRHVGYNDSLDIACTILETQQNLKGRFKPSNVLLNACEPKKGDVVHMITLDKLEISNYSPPKHKSGAGFSFSINRRVSIRVGTVTEVYPNGYRQFKWPCFTTSIPAEPGMSGGMVYIASDNGQISICGIVSADVSVEDAKNDNLISGESVIASAWAALSLPMPTFSNDIESSSSIYELMNNGQIHPANGLENIAYIHSELGNGAILYKKPTL